MRPSEVGLTSVTTPAVLVHPKSIDKAKIPQPNFSRYTSFEKCPGLANIDHLFFLRPSLVRHRRPRLYLFSTVSFPPNNKIEVPIKLLITFRNYEVSFLIELNFLDNALHVRTSSQEESNQKRFDHTLSH